MDAFEHAWQRIIAEFLKPAESLRTLEHTTPEHDFGVLMSEPAVGLSEHFDQREEVT
jgi:hypothetical protein